MTEDEKSELLTILLAGEDPFIAVGRVGPGEGILQLGLRGTNGVFTMKSVPARLEVLLTQFLEVSK
jgi:hypothetical protein